MKRGWLLPKRVPRPRSGIERAPQRIWPRHRRFVRTHACCVPGCTNPSEFAHVRSAANSGKDLKPFDWFGVSLCRRHHDEQHTTGIGTFMLKYQVDLWMLAAEFAERSPDLAMKAAMPIVRRSYPWSPITFPNRPRVLQ